MKIADLLRAWGRILTGRYPVLSIEITRECPLRCPGCYAYEPEHLGAIGSLRSLADYRGADLVRNVLKLVEINRPLHVSIVGGEPLVRYRELDELLPVLSEMGIAVQLVTSAVRPIPAGWSKIKNLYVVVSIDGLQPDHDRRRKPATYQRILQNIKGHLITVHCTITRQQTAAPDYFKEFLQFWSSQPEVKQIWFSLFTPQIGADAEEILPPTERARVIAELAGLRPAFPKLFLPDAVVKGFLAPPVSPDECLFASTTLSVTADLKNRIAPCQFGGNPDCSQCGCMASAGLKAVGDHKILGFLPAGSIYRTSAWIGQKTRGRNGDRKTFGNLNEK